MGNAIAVIHQFLNLLLLAAHFYLGNCATFDLFARFMFTLTLPSLALIGFIPSFYEVDDVLLKNTSFSARSHHLFKINFVLACPHFHCSRCKNFLMDYRILLNSLSLDGLRFFCRFLRLFGLLRRGCFHLEEDVANLACLILAVIELLDDALFGRGDFGELLIRFDVSQLSKLLDAIAFPHVQFLHTTLLDLLAQVRKGETKQRKGGS